MRATALLLAIVLGCAPTVDGPAERQQHIDETDARRLEHQLTALLGVTRATVVLRRPVADPFTQTRSSGSASVVVVVEHDAERAAIAHQASLLVHAIVPELPAPPIVVQAGLLVRGGSRSMTALAAFLAALAAIAGAIAWRERWRLRAGASEA